LKGQKNSPKKRPHPSRGKGKEGTIRLKEKETAEEGKKVSKVIPSGSWKSTKGKKKALKKKTIGWN